MARSVLLSRLRSDVQELGDWENAADRVTTAVIDRALNQAITETWLKIIRAGGRHKRTTTAPANTASGQASYALASDFLWGLDVMLTANGIERVLTNYMTLHEADYSDTGGGIGTPNYYAFEGDNLKFMPSPDGVYSYRYAYVATPTPLVNASDPFDGINGFEQHSVALAVKRIATRGKEWDLVAQMRQDIVDHERSIFDAVRARDPLPPQIVDVRGLERRNLSRRRLA